ncbi:divergent protein kinase domain 2A-like isoform X1 [Octopus sinensis]|uniref:Divergent protein kinase domain 2A-like isoform X1 n=1 Tax=Octopus sinensis TaxID=2607531 RepID=A0A6P7SA81_9MOLL|nr:divergent protein kinase domain 2A-like isoform X1 [Octopus sinensis]
MLRKIICIIKRLKLFLLVTLFFLIAFKFTIVNHQLTDVELCPVCYGEDFCRPLLNGSVVLNTLSSLMIFQFANVKNVYFAHYNNKSIVLKKLGHDFEIYQARKEICRIISNSTSDNCNVKKSFKKLLASHEFDVLEAIRPLLMLSSDLFRCPSQRLYKSILKHYVDKLTLPDDKSVNNLLHLITTNIVNPEPLIMQMFPSSNGWAFPKYYGSCGWLAAMSDEGMPLLHFVNMPWYHRANLTLQILMMAVKLSNSSDGWSLYWTDIKMDNLAVNSKGQVKIVDVENIIVVDRLELAKLKPPGWNQPAESVYDECDSDCISFSDKQLCLHLDADHNYYGVCRSLLSKYAYSGATTYGLLHHIPWNIEQKWFLGDLIKECMQPSIKGQRQIVTDKLIRSLQKIISRA